jgi:hypothetical protein
VKPANYLWRSNHSESRFLAYLAWGAILILLAVLLSTPIRLSPLEPGLSSLDSIGNSIAWFGPCFIIFAALTLGLALRRHAGDTERIVAISLFIFVFGYSIWTFAEAGRINEVFNFASDARFILTQGTIPFPLSYQGEPGIGLLVALVSNILDTSVFETIELFSFLESIVFVLLVFLFFKSILQSSYLASWGVIVIVFADIAVGSAIGYFWAATLGDFIFFPLLLMLMNVGKIAESRGYVSQIFIIASIAMVHFLTSVIVAIFFLLLYPILRWKNRGGKPALALSVVPLSFLLAWQTFANGTTAGTIVSLGESFVKSLSRIGAVAATSSGNLQTSLLNPLNLPLWASITEVSWAIVMLAASILAVSSMVQGRLDEMHIAGISTVILVFSIGVILTPTSGFGLGAAVFRTLNYAGFFTIPILVKRVGSLKISKPGIVAVGFTFIILTSLPTALVYHGSVATQSYSTGDLQLGRYLEQNLPRDSLVYGVSAAYPYLQYYLVLDYPLQPLYVTFFVWGPESGQSPNNIYQDEVKVIENFRDSTSTSGILVYSRSEWSAPFLSSAQYADKVGSTFGPPSPYNPMAQVYESEGLQVYWYK